MGQPTRSAVRRAPAAGGIPISLAGALIWSRVVTSDPSSDAVLPSRASTSSRGRRPTRRCPTDRLPVVELLGADGSTVELASDGRPMVVNLWYSTCPPCARELVDFAAVHEQSAMRCASSGSTRSTRGRDGALRRRSRGRLRAAARSRIRARRPGRRGRLSRHAVRRVATGSCSNAPGPSTPTSCASASPTTGPSGDEVT